MMRLSGRAAAVLGVSVTTACGAIAIFPAEAAPWWQRASAKEHVTDRPVPGSPPAAPFESVAMPIQVAADFRRYRDGVFTGPALDAYYGVVQVQATIRSGHVVAVNVLRHPFHSATSRFINGRALPRLTQEVMSAQSADVHAVSGATLTSEAFIRSMNGALHQALG